MKNIRCQHCKELIPENRKAMWEHALKNHWDIVIQHVMSKADGNLYQLGHSFGKELQKDGVKWQDLAVQIAKGFSNHGEKR